VEEAIAHDALEGFLKGIGFDALSVICSTPSDCLRRGTAKALQFVDPDLFLQCKKQLDFVKHKGSFQSSLKYPFAKMILAKEIEETNNGQMG
jgi:hypothetical protein